LKNARLSGLCSPLQQVLAIRPNLHLRFKAVKAGFVNDFPSSRGLS
jgi:hypothetical protein